MEEQPSFYSIVTADVRYNKNLKANEKLLFSEITALSNKNGYCYAPNNYFAELYDVDKTTVSKWISHLTKQGYLKSILIKDGKKIIERRLYPITTPIGKNANTPVDQKINTPIGKNAKDNNTSINKERDINKENQINEVSLVDNLLNYYAQQCAQWHEPFPEITMAEKSTLIMVSKGKSWKQLCDAVDRTIVGAENYPVGYLIRCIKNAKEKK